MTEQWQARGRIDRFSVAQVVLSPWHDQDRTLVAVTPAGLAIGRDGGERWETPARGSVGSFVRDLVWSAAPGAPGLLLASTPSGLWRSRDGGRSWDLASPAAPTGPLLALDDGDVLLVSEADGAVWRIRQDDSTPRPVGRLPGTALALAATDGETEIWAATTGGVFVSLDAGTTWNLGWRDEGQQAQALARCGPADVAIGTTGDGLRIRRGSVWESPAALRGQDIAVIAASWDGDRIVAGGSAGLFVSPDGGNSWDGPRFAQPVFSLAASTDSAALWAGLVSGGCARSSDRGETREPDPIPDGSVVVALRAGAGRLLARTAEGFIAESRDSGATWQPGPLPDEVRVQAVALPPSSAPPLFATDDGLLSKVDNETQVLHDAAFAHLASSERAPCLVLAAIERGVSRSSDRGQTWSALDLPLSDEEVIVDLAIGDGPGGEAGGLIAVGTVTAGDVGAVWLRHGAADWRRAIVHPEPAATVRLVAVPGTRGLFAGIDDSVYRPAWLGVALFAREVVAGGSAQILQLAAARGEDDVVLAALTTAGLALSRDGGTIWEDLPGPAGSPVTALTLRHTDCGIEAIAAQLGGQAQALAVA